MRIQPFSVIVQFTDYSGEVEIQHQITISVRGWVLSDVKVAKQRFELILGKYIIIVLQHIYCEAFAETARTNKEEKLVRLFYHGYKPGFVHIITVVAADYCKVHHAVWDTFPVRCYIFFHNLYLNFRSFL